MWVRPPDQQPGAPSPRARERLHPCRYVCRYFCPFIFIKSLSLFISIQSFSLPLYLYQVSFCFYFNQVTFSRCMPSPPSFSIHESSSFHSRPSPHVPQPFRQSCQPQEQLARGTVNSTMRRAENPAGCARRGAATARLAIRYQSLVVGRHLRIEWNCFK